MNKVAATYWDNSRTISLARSNRAKTANHSESATPQWFIFVVVAAVTFMLCLTINLRAFSEMSEEQSLHENLNSQIESLTTENIVLQEQIYDIKNDRPSIEREARRIGMSLPNE